jgi:hypothetical protein
MEEKTEYIERVENIRQLFEVLPSTTLSPRKRGSSHFFHPYPTLAFPRKARDGAQVGLQPVALRARTFQTSSWERDLIHSLDSTGGFCCSPNLIIAWPPWRRVQVYSAWRYKYAPSIQYLLPLSQARISRGQIHCRQTPRNN